MPALALRATVPLKPPEGVMLMVLVPEAPPAVSERLDGEADNEKLGEVELAKLLRPRRVPMPVVKSQQPVAG